MTIDRFLFHALLLFLMTGGIAGLFSGAMLVLRPEWLLRLSQHVNRWVATRRVTTLLETVVKADRWFYRHHQASGALLLGGSIFLLYFFSASFDKFHILTGLSRVYGLPLIAAEILLDSAVLSILMGAVFALIISLFMLLRPSMLRGFEQGANQWVSLRRAIKPLEISRFSVDGYVFQNVRMAGVLLLFGSLYTLAGLTVWL